MSSLLELTQQRNAGVIQAVAVDAHVHIHDIDNIDVLLDAASTNFTRWAGQLYPVLMLADMQGQDTYAALLTPAISTAWTIAPNADGISLRARHHDGRALTIVAGRQIVTSENIEVLALGTHHPGLTNAPLDVTLETLSACGAVVVLPWGFGKWLGARGALVSKAFAQHGGRLFVGDNGGRPSLSLTPKLLRNGYALGLPVLSGTDPLPVDGDFTRVGSRGVIIQAPVRLDWVGLDLTRALQEGLARVSQFGRGVSLTQFIRNQAALRATAMQGSRT